MALIVGAAVFDWVFAGVRFDEVDWDILFVYPKDEGVAAEMENNFRPLRRFNVTTSSFCCRCALFDHGVPAQ